ncbi:amidohydrolase [Mycolicibacterium vanbaalenii]|uniref:Amidohydrolase n=1 Tax=Mycolicibacterium vanbaalenii (strain DSM 7251 / JCM 13017 / BCRC 16820 / KCTC 9966 / NRRL B-24157 / PYR-1) TaxID=350058 RepID=A1TEB6_MYCVP|nr:amidohydrolase [Mycolicibacterium vanbaalenii]ABM15516.1 amidohydrolase [Mycolicibacterium vanbaalenii PYR-1]MCV7130927.1 amidohydrolase [Mycolicibacterium vanbaalenii PYR-1]
MAPSSQATTVLDGLPGIRSWQEDFYRDLHRHPELSHQEHRTAGKVVDTLTAAGYRVHDGIGGTGVIGILENGPGPTVLLRADMDALPVLEDTGLPYASTERATDPTGHEVPVTHACGHDLHVTALLGATRLLADGRGSWGGTLVGLFQPAEETGDGARGMVADGLANLLSHVDVCLGQHVMPFPAGTIGMHAGPFMASADSMRVTVYGRGSHGSMPQASVDPVVLAAMIVVRLQTVVSREVSPVEPVVLTVGSITSGSKSNVIPDRAVLQLNIRTFNDDTRTAVLEAVRRIVTAECAASRSPRDPEFELSDRFPVTDNDIATTERVTHAFSEMFGERCVELPQGVGSEDFSEIPRALGVPYTYWGVGCVDPDAYRSAAEAGSVNQDIAVNHSPRFAPVIQPTLDTATQALVAAAMTWLAPT